MIRGTALGLLVGLLFGSLISPLRAQDPAPWPAPEVCNDELLADYERREGLIFDLMMMLHVELYESGTRATIAWQVGEPPPGGLQDPTYHLVEARASK